MQPTESTPNPSSTPQEATPVTQAEPQVTPRENSAGTQLVPAPGQTAPALSIAPWDSVGGMVALGALIIGGTLVLTTWLRQRRGVSRPAAAAGVQTKTNVSAKREVAQPSQLEQSKAAAAELRQLTEELAAILDAKSQHLESVIAQADQRLARLDKATRSTTPSRDEARLPANASNSHSESRSSTLAASSTPSPHAHIHELADAGVPIVEIARRTGKATGTVELILNLRRSAAASR